MGDSSQPVEIIAFTKADEYIARRDSRIKLPYQRVVALQQIGGRQSHRIGEENTKGRTERVLSLSSKIGSRLMSSFSVIVAGRLMNCHRFSREISGMASSTQEPLLDFSNLPKATRLPMGAMGIIGVKGYGVPHSIGYGMGDEGLQVMSAQGELGFADNKVVVGFYQRLFPEYEVDLYKAR